jgi:hypothetical protein
MQRTSKRQFLVGAVAAAVLCTAGAAHAQDWKVKGDFGWFGVGKAFEIEKGHFYWVGEFSGTFFNDQGPGSPFHLAGVKCPAWYDLDLNRSKTAAGGYCIITDLDGHQAYLAWRNSSNAVGPGALGPGTFEYTGGTGKYQGISGSNTFVGVTQVNWADGTSSGYATWNR